MKRRFNRFELKYIIPVVLRDMLVEHISLHMTSDALGVDGHYRISSLYYDSPDLQCFRSKLDGIRFRRKVRIRWYGETPEQLSDAVMVEIKQRIDRTTQKRRVRLPLCDALALCVGQFDRQLDDPLDQAVAAEVTFLAKSLLLEPACLVVYQRQAFVGGSHDPGLRITFDADLGCALANVPPIRGRALHRFQRPDWVILEVKADDLVPLWVTRMLAQHSVTLNRFSKYCAAVAHLQERKLLCASRETLPWTI